MIDVIEIRYDINEGTSFFSSDSCNEIDDESYEALLVMSNAMVAKKQPERFMNFMNSIGETIGVVDDDGGYVIVDRYFIPPSQKKLCGGDSIWELTFEKDDDAVFLLTRKNKNESSRSTSQTR